MKLFFIVSIAFLAGVNSSTGIELQDDEKKVITECARELNTDSKKYTRPLNINAYAENPDEETTCMVACSFRRLISAKIAPELTGSSNRETLNNGLNKLIDEAYSLGFGEENTQHNRTDVTNKVKTCYDKETTECGLFKCVEVTKSPYVFVVAHYFLHGSLFPALKAEAASLENYTSLQ